MKHFITSQVRHFITAISFLIGFLVVRGLVTQDEASATSHFLLQHLDSISGFVATFLSRSVMWFSGKFFMGKSSSGSGVGFSCIAVLSSLCFFSKFGMGAFLAVMAVVLPMGLSSCTPPAGGLRLPENTSFKIFKRFDGGAKAGIDFSGGEARAFGRKTFLDADGNVMFEVDVESGLPTRPVVNPQK